MNKQNKEAVLKGLCYLAAGAGGWFLGSIYWVGLTLVIAAGIGLSFLVATWWD